jgi:hypothetical protein
MFKHGEIISGDKEFLKDWIGLEHGAASCFSDGFMFIVQRQNGRWVTLKAFDLSLELKERTK